MSGLIDLISQNISQEQVSQIAARLGASQEQTERAISLVVPTLVGAVVKKVDTEDGAQRLHQELGNHAGLVDGDLGGLLGRIAGSVLGGTSPTSSGSLMGGLLENLLGGKQSRVEQGIGKASGLNASQIGALMAMLAPLVMGALRQRQRTENMDADVLANSLRKERQSMENNAAGGLLGGLLDQDGDGDFDLQDVMKLGMKRFFGR